MSRKLLSRTLNPDNQNKTVSIWLYFSKESRAGKQWTTGSFGWNFHHQKWRFVLGNLPQVDWIRRDRNWTIIMTGFIGSPRSKRTCCSSTSPTAHSHSQRGFHNPRFDEEAVAFVEWLQCKKSLDKLIEAVGNYCNQFYASAESQNDKFEENQNALVVWGVLVWFPDTSEPWKKTVLDTFLTLLPIAHLFQL